MPSQLAREGEDDDEHVAFIVVLSVIAAREQPCVARMEGGQVGEMEGLSRAEVDAGGVVVDVPFWRLLSARRGAKIKATLSQRYFWLCG